MRSAGAVITMIVIAVVSLAAAMYVLPQWNVWRAEMQGKAALAQAENERKVLIEEAKARLESAKFYGLQAEGVRCTQQELKDQKLPAILFWEHNHFIVVEHFGKNWVAINDPATGRRQISYAAFQASFINLLCSINMLGKLYSYHHFLLSLKTDGFFSEYT
mgnify:CR=1 FL=1